MSEQVYVNPVVEALSRRQATHGLLLVWLQLAGQEQTSARSLAEGCDLDPEQVRVYLKLLGHLGLAVLHKQCILFPENLTSAHLAMLQDLSSGHLQINWQNATLQDETGLEQSLGEQVVAKFKGDTNLPGSIQRFSISGLLYTSSYLVAANSTQQVASAATSTQVATKLVAPTKLVTATKLVLPTKKNTLERDCKGKPLDAFLHVSTGPENANLVGDEEVSEDAETVFNYWKIKLEKPKARLVQGRLAHIRARFRDGFTVDEFFKVIDWVAGNAFLCGANKAGRAYNDFTTFARSKTRFQQYLEHAESGLENPGDERALLAASDAPVEVDYL